MLKKKNQPIHNYFQVARSWADDIYTTTITSRNRWRALSLFVLLPVLFLLLICICMLIPMQHLEPLLIHHYESGLVMVEPAKKSFIPFNQAQVESDIVHYILNRESYNSFSYKEQYSNVMLASNNDVSSQYMQEQNIHNKYAPINTLGEKGYRSVHINSILFLDSVNHSSVRYRNNTNHNLAQINFTITDRDKISGEMKNTALTAILSWEYLGKPVDPDLAWRNWDGFRVIYYEVQQQHVSKEES
jgi:type IV secretion system protein VirB8